MPRFGVALVTIVALAVLSLAVLLYLRNREVHVQAPVRPCKKDATVYYPPDKRNCHDMCGSTYAKTNIPVQDEEPPGSGQRWFFCCPDGLTACRSGNEHICKATCG